MNIPAIRIETPRLILRPTAAADFEGWAALMGDADAARYIGGRQARAVAWRGFLGMVGAWHVQGFAMFSVIEKASGRWLGRVGPWRPEGWPGDEIAWGLLPAAHGKGYATESAAAAADWAFAQLGWSEMIHTIAPDNHPSKRVAERLGSRFLRMGALPPPFEHPPVEIWGQSREQWQARRATPENP